LHFEVETAAEMICCLRKEDGGDGVCNAQER
jgi:hypothetical protein